MANDGRAGILMLRCRETGQPVNTRTLVTPAELARMRDSAIHVQCPLCSGRHGFHFSDAWIAGLPDSAKDPG